MEDLAKMRFLFLVVAVYVPSAWCASDTPAYCDVNALGTETGPDAYAFRDGNRCEGTYRLKLSGGSTRLSLRSLTSSRSKAPLTDKGDLRINCPPLPVGVRLRISVVPLDSPILYRMDTELDGATGAFRWPAKIARGWVSDYQGLGAVAFYSTAGRTVYVACELGPASDPAIPGLRADLLSFEPLHNLQIFSRLCRLSADCDSPEAGPLIGTIPGMDRDGTFTLNISRLSPTVSDFYNVRFAGQVTNFAGPPLAMSIILRKPQPGLPSGNQR